MDKVTSFVNSRKGNSSPNPDYPRILRTIEKLRAMTCNRGCTEFEAAVAARKIGEAIQAYDLRITAPITTRPEVGLPRGPRGPFITVPSVIAYRAAEKALLCGISLSDIWVPFSQIASNSPVREPDDFGDLFVTLWWFARSGLQGWRR